jgi:hypothetical protein
MACSNKKIAVLELLQGDNHYTDPGSEREKLERVRISIH